MTQATLNAQHHYRGALQLSFVERELGSAAAVAQKLTDQGFQDVAVYWDAPVPATFAELAAVGNAWAEATWPGPTTTAELPSQIAAFRDDGSVLGPPTPIVTPGQPPPGQPPAGPPAPPDPIGGGTINLIPGHDYRAALFLTPAELAAASAYEASLGKLSFADVVLYTDEADLDDSFAGVRVVPFANAWVDFTYSKLAAPQSNFSLPPEFLMTQDVTNVTNPPKVQPPAKVPPGPVVQPPGGRPPGVSPPSPGGLSTGAKVGIAVVAVVGGVLATIYFLNRRKTRKNPSRRKKPKAKTKTTKRATRKAA